MRVLIVSQGWGGKLGRRLHLQYYRISQVPLFLRSTIHHQFLGSDSSDLDFRGEVWHPSRKKSGQFFSFIKSP